MTSLTFKAIIFFILASISTVALPITESAVQTPTQAAIVPKIPVQTDDSLDPITLIWSGFAPSWWVASNILAWSDSAYCSGPKTVNGAEYNYTLERPDPTGIACFGPRDHVRIWDMGISPVFGRWSVGSAHHEHTVCDPVCHHVVDSWERAEADVRSSFLGGPVTVSVSNYTLGNSEYYQGIFNDGNATIIQLKPPAATFPVVFNENGLSNGTSWSVTINGTTLSSPRPDITFWESNGTYLFALGGVPGYDVKPSSGTVIVKGAGETRTVLFRPPWTSTSATVYSSAGRPISIGFSGNATVTIPTVHLTTTGITALSFTATEVGTKGVLSVTVPKSAVPSDSTVLVLVDGASIDNTRATEDLSSYYISVPLSYGTHSVELQFVPVAPQGSIYIRYIIGVALTAGVLSSLFVVVKMKRRQKASSSRNFALSSTLRATPKHEVTRMIFRIRNFRLRWSRR